MSNRHETYIRRCFDLALNGRGTTYPNPVVGAVLVHNGQIIGEGWHRKSGEPHAEVMAVKNKLHKELLKEATLYVNLEPCSFYGKTPACSTMIIREKIPRVVISNIDPNDKVAGKGVAMLRQAGIEVTTGILESDGRELNRFFFSMHERKRPYIILKWARTADGFMAPDENKKYWITNDFSRQLVHKWRSEIQGILIGKNTLLADNPLLDSRLWDYNSPVPIVLSGSGLKGKFALISRSERSLFLGPVKPDIPDEGLIYRQARDLESVLEVLYEENIQSVLVEGGRRVLTAFIEAGLWDEARIFTSPAVWGKGLKSPVLKDEIWLKTEMTGTDRLDYYYRRGNDYVYEGRYL